MKQTTQKLLHSPAAQLFSAVMNALLRVFIFGMVPVVLFIFITSRSPILWGIKSYVVQTGSMEPALEVGSMVFTYPQKSYKVGDVITFNRGKITITHRIHNITSAGFITKGDANNAADAQIVSKSNVIGKDVVVVPLIGRLTGFIKTPFGFGLLLGIPTLLFVIYEAFQIKKEWEKSIEQKIMKKLNYEV